MAADGGLGEAEALRQIGDGGRAVVQDGARDPVARRALAGREFLLRSLALTYFTTPLLRNSSGRDNQRSGTINGGAASLRVT